MLKDHSTNEPARIKAERKWRNHEVASTWKEFQIEERERAAKEAESQPPRVASVIENDEIIKGRVVRAQTKFAQEIRAMLEEHKRRNLLMYKLSLQSRIYKLKRAKLKLLEARAAQQSQKKDLFT